MSKTRVVHCRKEKFDVYIGRPSKWGNVFVIGGGQTREDVIRLHKEWLLERPEKMEEVKKELANKILGCWCHPKACHGDTYVELCETGRIKLGG